MYIYYRTYNIAPHFAQASSLCSWASDNRDAYRFFVPCTCDNTDYLLLGTKNVNVPRKARKPQISCCIVKWRLLTLSFNKLFDLLKISHAVTWTLEEWGIKRCAVGSYLDLMEEAGGLGFLEDGKSVLLKKEILRHLFWGPRNISRLLWFCSLLLRWFPDIDR